MKRAGCADTCKSGSMRGSGGSSALSRLVIHCETKQEAEQLLLVVKERLEQVGFRLNEEKTKIVYCKDYRRKEKHAKVQFGLMGFSYQPRKSRSKYGAVIYSAFTAEISRENQKKNSEEATQNAKKAQRTRR
jgi:RNA-directed DNA polymerase